MHDKKFDFGQLYGYTVCLVAILVFLFACAGLTIGIVDLREPPYTQTYREGPTLVSLDAYKMDLLARTGCTSASGGSDIALPAQSAASADSGFARMYEAERLYRLALSHQASRRRIVVSLVLLGGALLLFASHAAWLASRSRPREADDM